MTQTPGGGRLTEVAGLFLKLGVIAFGGPAAHVALMRREVVNRRHWLGEDQFDRMFAACNLIPGPTSTELAIYIGYQRAGWRALILAGTLFILPAMVLMLVAAWAYRQFGLTRPMSAILYGVRPVIVGILIWALFDLTRHLVKGWPLLLLAVTCAALSVLGLDPIVVLVLGGLVVAACRPVDRTGMPSAFLPLPLLAAGGISASAAGKLLTIFLTFLKIGTLSFGSGYVLLALLRTDFVNRLHWLTDRQLVDAIAIGQATPGPLFTTATFLGYLFAGVAGALLATVAIFAPGFLLVPFLDRIVEAVGRRRWAQGFVDGANAAAIGLIAAVALQLGRVAIVDPLTIALGLATVALVVRWPMSSAAAIFGGAGVGLIAKLLM